MRTDAVDANSSSHWEARTAAAGASLAHIAIASQILAKAAYPLITRFMRRSHFLPGMLGLLSLACGSPSEPSGIAGLRITSMTPPPDTIGAMVADPVRATLMDRGGRPVAGAEVSWSADGLARFARNATSYSDEQMLDTTDAQGRASAFVYRGSLAGLATIRIRATGTDEVDSLTLLIQPGNPTSVQALPADTALRVGAGFRIRATVHDRAGNARTESPAVATVAATPALAIVDADSVVAQQIARVAVQATFGELTDTTWISVVPTGVLAAYMTAPSTGGQDALAVFDTDGRDWRLVRQTPFPTSTRQPWPGIRPATPWCTPMS